MAGAYGPEEKGLKIGVFWSGIQLSTDGKTATLIDPHIDMSRKQSHTDTSTKLVWAGGAVTDSSATNLAAVSGPAGIVRLVTCAPQTVTLKTTGTVTYAFNASLTGLTYGSPDVGEIRVDQNIVFPKFTSAPPLPPTNVKATISVSGTINTVTITWTNAHSTAAPYHRMLLQRMDNINTTWVTQATITNTGAVTSYADKSPVNNRQYTYRLAAQNAAATSAYVTAVPAVKTKPNAPTAPVGLPAVARSVTGDVVLNWVNNAPYVSGWRIFRSSAGGAFVQISTTLLPAVRSYVDVDPSPTVSHRYQVVAYATTATTPAIELASTPFTTATIAPLGKPNPPTVTVPSVLDLDTAPLTVTVIHNSVDSTVQTEKTVQWRNKAGAELAATADVSADLVTRTAHGLATGSPVRFAGSPPTSLAVGTIYYARVVDVNRFYVAATAANAAAGTPLIDLGALQGTFTVITGPGGVWTSVTVAGPGTTYTIPAGTLTNGYTYEFQAATRGQHASFSNFSSPSVLAIGSTKPLVTFTNPVDVITTAILDVEWSYVDPEGTAQSAWTVKIFDDDGSLLRQASGTGPTAKWRVPFALLNARTYTLEVRVKDGTGLWSDIVRETLDTQFAPPPDAVVSGLFDVETGQTHLQIQNPPPEPGGAQAYAQTLQRFDPVSREWVTVLADIPSGASVVTGERMNMAHDPAATLGAFQGTGNGAFNSPAITKLGWGSKGWGTGGAGTWTWQENADDGPLEELNSYLSKCWTVGGSGIDVGFQLAIPPATATPIRKNRFPNPRAAGSIAPFGEGMGNWSGLSLQTAGTNTGVPDLNTYVRTTCTKAETASSREIHAYNSLTFANPASGTGIPVTAGSTVTLSAHVYFTQACDVGLQVRFSAGTAWVGAAISGPQVLTQENDWLRISQTVVVPAGATHMSFRVYESTSISWIVGDRIQVTGVLVEVSGGMGVYFDGSTQGDNPEPCSVAWEGAVNNSISDLYDSPVVGWKGVSVSPNDIFTVSAYLRSNVEQVISKGWRIIARFYTSAGVLNTTVNGVPFELPTDTWVRVWEPFLVPTNCYFVSLTASNTVSTVMGEGQCLDGTGLMFEAGGNLGDYFDGDSVSTDPSITHYWTGTANASPSVEATEANQTGVVVDPIPPLNQEVQYRVIVYAEDGSSNVGEPVVVATTDACYSYLNGGSGWSIMAKFKGSPEVGINRSRERVLHTFAGRESPLEYLGVGRTRVLSVRGLALGVVFVDECRVTKLEMTPWDAWEMMEDVQAPLCYRDARGIREFCSISSLSVDLMGNMSFANVGFTLTKVHHDENAGQ